MREDTKDTAAREANKKRPDMSTKDKIITFFKRFGIFIVFAIAAVYAIFTLISQQSRLDEVNERNEELQEQMEDLESQASDLEAELEHAGSDEYAEDTARDKLGWVKEDELVFKEGEDSSQQDTTKEE